MHFGSLKSTKKARVALCEIQRLDSVSTNLPSMLLTPKTQTATKYNKKYEFLCDKFPSVFLLNFHAEYQFKIQRAQPKESNMFNCLEAILKLFNVEHTENFTSWVAVCS